MIPQSTETEPKLSELLTTAAIYQLDAQDTHQMNVMAEMAASLEAQVKAMREAGEAVVNRWEDPKWEWDKHGHTASLIADLRKSLDTPTPPNK